MLRKNTAALLRDAARAEFDEVGYDGTNSNRIARRAGFAPQTFYRHYPDKLAILLAVYDSWVTDEIERLTAETDRVRAARIIVGAHRASLRLRRSLRALTYTEPAVAQARAAARDVQIAKLAVRAPQRSRADIAAAILLIERLADAIAEGELLALGVSEENSIAQLVSLLFW